ncbi:VOC family protein [Ensifer sp. NPDC090286]|uniref:VOC family protein n=1 Tax=Ensifer sp. NPDC090286 TaxID=3363991 RepID=UPI00383A5498
MRISRLILPASNVSKSAGFFRDILDLPTAGGVIRIGWSEIQLIPAVGETPHGVHLAFNVPYARFDAAAAWLKERTSLQSEPDGNERFALEADWQSRSVYFDGPDNAVLELIGRRRLVHPAGDRPFSGADLHCLSEVGIPVDDVEGTAAEAAWTFGVGTVGSASASFAAIGDDEGLLIAVEPNRPWFPEKSKLPGAYGLEIWVSGVRSPGTMSDVRHGWKVRTR